MSNPHVHAMSSANKYGGSLEDYLDIHEFMDTSKGYCPDNRHRVLTHTPFFVEQVLPRVFGLTRTNSGGKLYWVKQIGYDHITEDFHQSNLLRKDPVHYSNYFKDVPADLEYVWPT